MAKRTLSWTRALVVAALAAVPACAPADGTSPPGDETGTEGDEIRVCADGPTIKGIDVSVHNGAINWSKAAGSGLDFAVARVSDGLHHPDTQFATNWKAIQQQGLVRGVYQYFRASQDAVAQADYLVDQIGALEPNDLPPVIDVETADGVSTTKVVAGVRKWLDQVKLRTGVDGIIYAASGFWNTLPSTAQFSGNVLWVANYGASCPSMPQTWKHWAIWQYSESGSVPGVSGGIDLDKFNGTLAGLQALTVQGAPPPAAGCAGDADCGSGETCDKTQTPAACVASAPPPPPPTGCPLLSFPSGINIQTVEDAATTASYVAHLAAGQTAPKCFIDVKHLVDPIHNTTYDLSVHVAKNFQLSELVGTEVSQGWGSFVLISPAAVAALQKFRDEVGGPVSINSGFRSPKHQESVCNDLCGNPYGCSGTCANNSRHMWGDAFDLPMAFYNTADTNLACTAGFDFTYLESGTHLHIDQNPAYTSCVHK